MLTKNQKLAIKFLEQKESAGVFFSMATGKTLLTLSFLKKHYLGKKILLITPASVAQKTRVWQEEIKKWDFMEFEILEYFGKTKKALNEFIKESKKKVKLFLVSSTTIANLNADWRTLFDLVIIDESSQFKNPRTKRFKKLKTIRDQVGKCILLTGTPAPKSYADLWSQLYLIDGGKRLGNNYYNFLKKYAYFYGDEPWQFYFTDTQKKEIDRLINDICIYSKNENLGLKKTEHKVLLSWKKDVLEKYEDFKKTYVFPLLEDGFTDDKISVNQKNVLITKCLQLSNGFIYDSEKKVHEFDNFKFFYLRKLVNEDYFKDNILVFYSFKTDKEKLLTIKGARAIETAEDVVLWNEGKIKVGVISPYSFQYGGNFQYGGATIVWFGLTWNLENFLQSNARVLRPGQNKHVHIYYLLIKNTYDERVLECLKTKKSVQDALLEQIKLEKIKTTLDK